MFTPNQIIFLQPGLKQPPHPASTEAQQEGGTDDHGLRGEGHEMLH